MISFSFDAARKLRIAVFTGVVTDEELVAGYEKLVIDPAYEPAVDDLIDMSEVERLDVSRAGLQRVLAIFVRVAASRADNTPTRLAIVAASPQAFGAVRLYEVLRGQRFQARQLEIFRTRERALEWLERR